MYTTATTAKPSLPPPQQQQARYNCFVTTSRSNPAATMIAMGTPVLMIDGCGRLYMLSEIVHSISWK